MWDFSLHISLHNVNYLLIINALIRVITIGYANKIPSGILCKTYLFEQSNSYTLIYHCIAEYYEVFGALSVPILVELKKL